MIKKHPTLMALGNRIRALREELGWSQEKLAENSDLDRTYIGGIERGERNVAVLNLRQIANALKISLKELFDKIA